MKPKLQPRFDSHDGVQRFDFAQLRSKPTRTPQGFLRVDANLTRTGVLVYKNLDGTETRELRTEKEVFDDTSLATLASAPVTDMHPTQGMVNPSNISSLTRGVVSGQARRDGDFVTASVIIQDAELIDKVVRGDSREVSCGYLCQVEMTPGVTEGGEKYDGIQRHIVYNHLAVGPAGWARAGSDVALRMDSGLVSFDTKMVSDESIPDLFSEIQEETAATLISDLVVKKLNEMEKGLGHLAEDLGVATWTIRSFLRGNWGALREARGSDVPETGLAKIEDFNAIAKFVGLKGSDLFDLVPKVERGDGKPPEQTNKGNPMETVTITLDGVDYELPKIVAPHIEKAIKTRNDAAEALTTRATEAETKASTEAARADGLVVEVADLKTKLATAESPEHIDGLVKERAALEAIATSVLGKDAKFDGKDAKAIKIECIAHTDSAFDAKDKDDVYIQGRFDGIAGTVKVDDTNSQARKDAAKIALDSRNGSNDKKPDSEQARLDFKKKSDEAWQQPLTISQ